MNIIKKVILQIKSIFIKQKEVEKLSESKISIKEDKNESFIESLKTATIGKRENKKIETLICEGDGLGIQKKITY